MKLRFNIILLLVLLVFITLPKALDAQVSSGGVPKGFTLALPPDTTAGMVVTPPATDGLLQEDALNPRPYRFAVNIPVEAGIDHSGHWIKTSDGSNVWRLNVQSPGALAMTLYFDRFNLPEGGKLFVYNPQRTQVIGAFTSMNNNNLSTFATALIYGDHLTLEYNAPEGISVPEIHIAEVAYAYRGVTDYSSRKIDFGGSGPCEVNVNCPEGSNWQMEKRSVTRITVKRGGSSLWCTGSLIKNVRNDRKPYILTADHCGNKSSVTDLSQWIFYFNYEGAGCPDPTTEPPLKSITGATLVAHGGNEASTGSDFFLVLLKSAIPDSYNVSFNGWSRETAQPSPSGTTIHHPQGDIKKISTYTTPLQPAHWSGNPALAHWRVTWTGTPSGHGTTEGGSSGSPLFDNYGRLVGTLTGGDSGCDSAALNLPDYYGMFSYSWDKNGTDSVNILKCWLDPDNTGVMTLNGNGLPVGEPVENEWVKIFPNPVKDQLNIISSSVAGTSLHLTIYDIWGKLCRKYDWNASQDQQVLIDLSELAAGMYTVSISDGNRKVVRKVIKQ